MQRVVFYSWQADRPNNTNRGFIKSALEEAAAALAGELTVEPRVDHDTQNVPGSPDIAHTILKKIATSDVFVADVTIINEPNAGRPTPNPNVLLELGYAMHALGEDRIILVMNKYFGRVEQLPFDLRARRTIVYDIDTKAPDRATERHRLASILTAAIKQAIAAIPEPPPVPSTIELAQDAIDTAASNRAVLVRKAMQALTTQFEPLAPPAFHRGGTVEHLLTSLQATTPVVRDFTLLAQAIASMNDPESARALYKAFNTLLEHYENPPRFTGSFDERDFDYWKFLGHQLITTLIAVLLREERYGIIKDLLDETIIITNHRYKTGSMAITYEYASKYLKSLEPESEARRRLSVHADLLRDRHSYKGEHDAAHDGPLADVLPFDEFLAADYFLWLRGELAPSDDPTGFFEWIPWTSGYLQDTPAFLRNATRRTIAIALAGALNVPDVSEFRERLKRRAARIGRMWPPYATPIAARPEDIDRIGTRT